MKKLTRPSLEFKTAGEAGGNIDFDSWGVEPEPGFLYVTTRAISSRVNANYDGWPPQELQKSYKTFVGKPVYVEHDHFDYNKTRGVIVDAKLHQSKMANGIDDYWVELLIEVDQQAYPKLAQAILNGDVNAVSMGADVAKSQCSFCGNVATSPMEFCEHVNKYKGQYLKKNGQTMLVYEKCLDVSFFEISFVFDPADESAFIFNVHVEDDSKSNLAKVARVYKKQRESVRFLDSGIENRRSNRPKRPGGVHRRVADKEVAVLPPEVDTLAEEMYCEVCGVEIDYTNDYICPNCGHENIPDDLGDPDTEPTGEAKERYDKALELLNGDSDDTEDDSDEEKEES